ncbi:uncharacterized protein FOMMEDRAFT_30887 [Fomitiporia mediterranea MF3/22]|uniref:uncharacterized protein n=1 Tax=Fomitiporia mediterranea (strain MF3/22) TaxID=694068 RepID=UPI0004407732|nr:uncharacterized protein FOMMEDRAFT_30887 [Fomitiporia mediterranea MF3/22]EJD00260.1 hypothetical protein FOMMEDRAFT_30887 [Fomitiporia mediterranea MF3/22]
MSKVSAVSRVFDLAELKNQVFIFLDKKAIAKCAIVCKSWTKEALYRLWRDLESIFPLLRLLGEFEVEGRILLNGMMRMRSPSTGPVLTFNEIPCEHRWMRFNVYASLVRKLQLSNYSDYKHAPLISRDHPAYFGRSMLEVLSNGEKYPRLLPNLENLHVDASIDVSIFSLASLLFGELKSLEFAVDIMPRHERISLTPLKLFLKDVLALSPNLQCFGVKAVPGLEIHWHGKSLDHHAELEWMIQEFLIQMPNSLTVVKVNSTMLTPDLFNMLSTFPRIQSLQNSGRRSYYAPRMLTIPESVDENAFAALNCLFLPIEARTAVLTLARLSHILGHLTSLSVACRDYATPEKCHDLFIAISRLCPGLSSLEIVACTSRGIIGGYDSPDEWYADNNLVSSREKRARLLSINLLLELRNLKELTILLDFILPITDEELDIALLRRRTPLEVLQLSWNPRRLDLDHPNLTFDAICIVARRCPRIRILSLFVIVPQCGRFGEWFPTFKCLEELNLGLSYISTLLINRTAMKLSELFRDVIPEVSVSQHTGDFDKCQLENLHVGIVQENWMNWEKVVNIMHRVRGVPDRSGLRRFARSERRVVDQLWGRRVTYED